MDDHVFTCGAVSETARCTGRPVSGDGEVIRRRAPAGPSPAVGGRKILNDACPSRGGYTATETRDISASTAPPQRAPPEARADRERVEHSMHRRRRPTLRAPLQSAARCSRPWAVTPPGHNELRRQAACERADGDGESAAATGPAGPLPPCVATAPGGCAARGI